MGIKRILGTNKSYDIVCNINSFVTNNSQITGVEWHKANIEEFIRSRIEFQYLRFNVKITDLTPVELNSILKQKVEFDYLHYHCTRSGQLTLVNDMISAFNGYSGRQNSRKIALFKDDYITLRKLNLVKIDRHIQSVLEGVKARKDNDKKAEVESERRRKEAIETERIKNENKTKEEWRQFLRGNVTKISQEIYFTSHTHQLTERAIYAESFFKRCFDKELKNNKNNWKEVYNPNLGTNEQVSLSHLFLTHSDVLLKIKENIAKSLSHNWMTLLEFNNFDCTTNNSPRLYDFSNEILDDRRHVNVGIRCIEFTDLSEVFQTFINKALNINGN